MSEDGVSDMEEKETRTAGGKRVAPKGKGRKAAAIAAAVILVLLAGGYLGLCAWAGRGNTLLPNTAVGGVELGGMTADQAAAVLTRDLTPRLESMRLDFLCGGKLYTVYGNEFTFSAEDTASALFAAQNGPFLTRGGRFLLSLARGGGHPASLTLSALPAGVDQAVTECADADTQTTWEVQGESLVMTKGRTGRTMDVPSLTAALTQRANQLLDDPSLSFAPLEAQVEESAPIEPDLDLLHTQLCAQVADAYLDKETGEIVPSVTGMDFDVDRARAAWSAAGEGETFRVPLDVTQPAISTQLLTESLFRDVLGEAVTYAHGTADRKLNIRVAGEFMNDTILLPGEEFSFNQVCSPYSVDNGYGKATAYVNGLSKDTVAGGICQASSTLYWAALKANLETVERWAHRYEPSYIVGGLDATVYGDYGEEGSLDYRFVNNTDYPIKIESYMDEKHYIHVILHGTDTTGIHGEPYSAGRVVTLEAQTKYEPNETVPQGTTRKDPERTAYNAVTIETYQKLVDADGKVVETKYLYKTNYKARDAVILYNPADAELWGIDPATGLQTSAPSASPAESGVPESPAASPETSGDPTPPPAETPYLPPEASGQPILPPEIVFTPPPVPTPSDEPQPQNTEELPGVFTPPAQPEG